MYTRRIPVPVAPLAMLFLVMLGMLLLAGCGSNGTTSSTTQSSASLTATACVRATRTIGSARTNSGTLQSINGQTLVIKNLQGKTITATYTSATRFTQQSIIPASMLKEGTPVVVLVSSSGSTYSATSITVTTGTGGFPRAGGTPGTGRFSGGAGNPCLSRSGLGQLGTGTSSGNFRGLTGTVSGLNSTNLTITDTSGSDFSVTITPQTQITETQSITASALKVGMALSVSGTTNSQGMLAARSIIILLRLPTVTPTP